MLFLIVFSDICVFQERLVYTYRCHHRHSPCQSLTGTLAGRMGQVPGTCKQALSKAYGRTGLHREFGGPFFQTGKTQGICQTILKICFCTGNLTLTQEKFGGEKDNEL